MNKSVYRSAMAFEIKFCPALAQLRELMRIHFAHGDRTDNEINKSFNGEKYDQIIRDLKSLNITDSQRFICLVCSDAPRFTWNKNVNQDLESIGLNQERAKTLCKDRKTVW